MLSVCGQGPDRQSFDIKWEKGSEGMALLTEDTNFHVILVDVYPNISERLQ